MRAVPSTPTTPTTDTGGDTSLAINAGGPAYGEYQADAFAARHASPAELIAALVALYRDNAATLTPDPLHSRFYDSHPPASLRIAHLKELSA